MKDKIVFFSNRMERTRDGSGYGKAVAVRAPGPSAAAALGALGVVIRSISTSDARFPHTGAHPLHHRPRRAFPALAISNPDADALERQFESGKPVRLSLKSSSRELPQVRSANVVGEIPGTDLANEIVILGAHLDSWDPGVGALDDGAGVAIMMGVAKLIKDLDVKPRRTIRVVLFANEEFGTSGSLAYVAANEADLARHVLGFEADFGAGPVWRLSSRVNPAQLPAVEQIFRALAPLKLVRGDNEAAAARISRAWASSACRSSSPGSTAPTTSMSTTRPTTRWRRWTRRRCASPWRPLPPVSGWAPSIRALGNA